MQVRSMDNKLYMIPNSKLNSSTVTNLTTLPGLRLDIPVKVSYDADIDQAEAEMLAVAAREQRIHKEPAPCVLVKGFEGIGVELALRVLVDNKDAIPVRPAI